MSYMFYLCSSLIDFNINNFKTDKVTDMSHMFYYYPLLKKLDISNLDSSNVEYIIYFLFLQYDYRIKFKFF